MSFAPGNVGEFHQRVLSVIVANLDETGIARITTTTILELVGDPLGRIGRKAAINVANSVKHLEYAGAIRIEKEGRRNVYRVIASLDPDWIEDARARAADLAENFLDRDVDLVVR